MKIKRSFYCIVDRNNKPDYRFLFECPEDAWAKIKKIKNSIKGETLVSGMGGRDFFAEKTKRNFIGAEKKISLKRGCWTNLKVKKINMMDDFKPEKVFKKIIKAKENKLCYSKQRETSSYNYYSPKIKLPAIANPLLGFSWHYSFIRTKSFAVAFSILCAITTMSVALIHKNTTDEIAQNFMNEQKQIAQKTAEIQTRVLGKNDAKNDDEFEEELDKFVVEALKRFETIKQEDMEKEIRRMVAGFPIEQMIPYIVEKDRTVAAFLVGIAKKESNWGKRVPVLNGQDCYNYWGYRGIREKMGTGGHTCFDSPQDAVDTVAKRLQDLVQSDIKTPEDMIIWKCGSTCDGHSAYSVQKWISDVDMYFKKIEQPAG